LLVPFFGGLTLVNKTILNYPLNYKDVFILFLDKILGIFIISRYTLLMFCCQGSFAILFHSIFNAHISS
jgi:hypothetical protein